MALVDPPPLRRGRTAGVFFLPCSCWLRLARRRRNAPKPNCRSAAAAAGTGSTDSCGTASLRRCEECISAAYEARHRCACRRRGRRSAAAFQSCSTRCACTCSSWQRALQPGRRRPRQRQRLRRAGSRERARCTTDGDRSSGSAVCYRLSGHYSAVRCQSANSEGIRSRPCCTRTTTAAAGTGSCGSAGYGCEEICQCARLRESEGRTTRRCAGARACTGTSNTCTSS